MTKMADEQPTFKVIENPHAGEVFADAAASFSLAGGVVRVTFTAFRPLEVGGESAHVVIGRLAIPVEGAQGLAIGLYDFLKQRGLDPSTLVSGGQSAQ
jgi:hypothetical protein